MKAPFKHNRSKLLEWRPTDRRRLHILEFFSLVIRKAQLYYEMRAKNENHANRYFESVYLTM